MDRNRRSSLTGLATLAGAVTANRAAAQQMQHVHPPAAPANSVVPTPRRHWCA